MKKIFLIILPVFLGLCTVVSAKEPNLACLAAINPETATQAEMTALLGKPNKIEENKKTTQWYYTLGEDNLVLSWSNKSDEFIKCSFTRRPCQKCVFDARLSKKLHSGRTDLAQTLALLGPPKQMTIKESKQEVHYAYQNNVLRLFFRDRVLVDYTLLGQGGN